MLPNLPHWLKQRQIKVEEVNPTTLRLNGPNLPIYELAIKPSGAEGNFTAALLQVPVAGGPSELVTETPAAFQPEPNAWQAAFELYRQRVVV